eukprot:gene58004-biopygen63341
MPPGSTWMIKEALAQKHKELLGKENVQMYTVNWRDVLHHRVRKDMLACIVDTRQHRKFQDGGLLLKEIADGQDPDQILKLLCGSEMLRHPTGRHVGEVALRHATPDASGRSLGRGGPRHPITVPQSSFHALPTPTHHHHLSKVLLEKAIVSDLWGPGPRLPPMPGAPRCVLGRQLAALRPRRAFGRRPRLDNSL